MKISSFLVLSTLVATPAFAEETRHLDSHEHGVGQLDIAFDGTQIAMELHAPGADIIGFEYVAESAEDLAKIETALTVLEQPLDLFVVPEAAHCSVVDAHAALESEEGHMDHDDHEDEGHDDHDDHDHDEHAEDDHDDHEDEAAHTEFHAEYLLNCDHVFELNEISFAYFAAFPNALEVEVQIVSDAGATAFEIERDAPVLDLSDLN
ncbi:DUF2796 domain-containing protein [Loktanella sp. D2R18]|nr:DUF2796 domain-containing protein [Yoonia sp. 1_MG-2023]MDO6590001.1 DUF2796 domain-containing protein [Yoonia sp. 1_MG-2023]RBW46022.1 DUF2796 domain-containing protein [Loktanella sp. D2R18]